MWKLTIEDDEGKQTQLPLAYDEYGLGRAESNAIRLTDRNVSRRHAVLRKGDRGWHVLDQQSYNGTYINGTRVIGEQAAQSGDVVQLGDYRLEFLDEGVVGQAASERPPPSAVSPAHQRPNRLVVVVGPRPGTEFPLDKDHFAIGRAEDATISINHSSVSRLHAELFALGNGRFEIVDKGSANGVRINGVDLRRGILEAGDALELGDVRLRFVGAGKTFRADASQQLAAATGFETMARSIGSGSRHRVGLGKLIGIGVGLGMVLILGVVVLVARSHRTSSEAGTAPRVVNEKNASLLAEAVKLHDHNEHEAAHKKLLEIPEDVRPTDVGDFKRVELGWADFKFQQAEKTSDPKAKKALLREIASTETVDPRQRTRAAEMMHQIEAAEPQPGPTSNAPGSYAPGTFGAGPTGGSGVGGPMPGSGKALDTPTPTPVAASGPPNEEQIRRQIEPRVWGGKGSIDDIRMLKAICSHMGDQVCRVRAAEMLKKKQEQ